MPRLGPQDAGYSPGGHGGGQLSKLHGQVRWALWSTPPSEVPTPKAQCEMQSARLSTLPGLGVGCGEAAWGCGVSWQKGGDPGGGLAGSCGWRRAAAEGRRWGLGVGTETPSCPSGKAHPRPWFAGTTFRDLQQREKEKENCTLEKMEAGAGRGAVLPCPGSGPDRGCCEIRSFHCFLSGFPSRHPTSLNQLSFQRWRRDAWGVGWGKGPAG